MDICWIVADQSDGVEEEPKRAVDECSIPVAALAEDLATFPLREESVLLALVGLAGLII